MGSVFRLPQWEFKPIPNEQDREGWRREGHKAFGQRVHFNPYNRKREPVQYESWEQGYSEAAWERSQEEDLQDADGI